MAHKGIVKDIAGQNAYQVDCFIEFGYFDGKNQLKQWLFNPISQKWQCCHKNGRYSTKNCRYHHSLMLVVSTLS